MNRKITYIDVSDWSAKELSEYLGVKYTPWYRDSFFWAVVLALSPMWLHPLTHL